MFNRPELLRRLGPHFSTAARMTGRFFDRVVVPLAGAGILVSDVQAIADQNPSPGGQPNVKNSGPRP